MYFASWLWWLSILLIPILPAVVDLLGPTRASLRHDPEADHQPGIRDWTILVPLYGNVRFLTNRDWLASYGDRVTIVTTDIESDEFEDQMGELVERYGWSHLRIAPQRFEATTAKRRTSGTLRDQLIRDGLTKIATKYMITLDADTSLPGGPDAAVAALVDHDLDIASGRLVPSNTDRLLGKLQAHEYRIVMRLRRIAPWLVSGAFQVSRTDAMVAVMNRHSLFFQGNDAEIGLLGQKLGYRVGWLPIEVPTEVPDHWRPWLRQRWAWTGGEFRLWIINGPRLVRKHPFFIGYGALIVTLSWPLREYIFAHTTWQLAGTVLIYLGLVSLLNRHHLDWAILVYPIYGLAYSLLFVPMGIVSYTQQALSGHNAGIIRGKYRRRHAVSSSS